MMKVPVLMQEDVLDAMFEQQMTVPTHRDSWERFRQDLTRSFSQLFSPAVMQLAASGPLDLPVSLLVQDIAVREYDFSVSVNAQGASYLALSSCKACSCREIAWPPIRAVLMYVLAEEFRFLHQANSQCTDLYEKHHSIKIAVLRIQEK